MSAGVSRALVTAACLVWLAACESSSKTGGLFRPAKSPDTTASAADATALVPATPASATATASAGAPAATADVTGSVFAPLPRQAAPELPPVPGPDSAFADPNDQLSLGKRHFREENYGLAEMYFRRVVEHESVPTQRKAEAWVGLAASYDRLKRFDLADRAYAAAIGILGATPEILNNQGFSYMLRGDFPRARAKLTQALDKDPTNPFIQNNLQLLERSMRGGGGRKKV
jgi:tetratricopeptide (TPR) repeat protein